MNQIGPPTDARGKKEKRTKTKERTVKEVKEKENVVIQTVFHLVVHLCCCRVFLKFGQQLSGHGAYFILTQISILSSRGSTVTRQLMPGAQKKTTEKLGSGLNLL